MVPVRRRGACFLLARYRAHGSLVSLLLLLGVCQGAGDLVARLYRLETSGASVAKLALSAQALPSTVSSRLASHALVWDDLSGLMQRALLWDSGYVFASSAPTTANDGNNATLVRIFTACNEGMDDLLPGLAEIETLSKQTQDETCRVQSCGVIGHFLEPRNCSVARLRALTRCAVVASAMDGHEQVAGVYWAEDGRSASVPEPVVRRHTSLDTDASESLFAIHLSATAFTGLESCEPETNFILPCRGMDETLRLGTANASRQMEINVCPPVYGAAMDAWLRVLAEPSRETFSVLAIVMLVVLMLLCVVLILAVWWLKRSRDCLQDAYDRVRLEGAAGDDGCWSPTLNLLGPLASSKAVSDTFDEKRLTPMEVFFGARPRDRQAASKTNDTIARTRAEITVSNDQLCRKSSILRAFVSDPAIVTKRISFAQLHFLRLLAKGGSGEVWLGQYETRYVAMKCLLPTKRENPETLEQFADEIRMASLLAHPRIVAFCGVAWQSLLHLCAVTEYMPRGDLESLLANPVARQELILEGKRYDEKSDLFSFGVVLSEIDTCALPYEFSRRTKMRSMQIVHLVSKGKLLPSFREDCPASIRTLAQRCLSLDPAARPTAMEVAYELRSSIAPKLLEQLVSMDVDEELGTMMPSREQEDKC
ncbi:hypothetical protein PsorP6_014301 [Peronosclerospora sorghi]|uniref:Uncharacterized protein n=1 Tax=Peronosclerospora sorghi TaxID=230839 RepID=A0ACC0VHK0_9STRA|nr:hypothetical protein PsorP6_014301 [Peronosclerospora sorghi]